MKQSIYFKGKTAAWGVLLSMLTVAGFTACSMDDGDEIPVSEFGATKKEQIVGYQKGSVNIHILANRDYEVSFVDPDQDWAEFEGFGKEAQLSGDDSVKVNFTTNEGFPRMAGVLLTSGDRCDTVFVKQRGFKTPQLKFSSSSIAIMGDGGQTTAPLVTNIALDNIKQQITYTNEGDAAWVSDLQVSNGYLIMQAGANTDQEQLRRARITFTYLTGWRETLTTTLYMTQANAKNEFGRAASFEEVRDMNGKVDKDIYIEGYIVSQRGNANNGENTRTGQTGIDYTGSPRTAYIESTDGRYGFMIKTQNAEDNIFDQYSKVRLLLRDAIILQEINPMRFTIKNVSANMVLSSEAGSVGSLPVKEKHMGALTDEDIFTWVKLTDCEFPIRKGSMTPINEGYGYAFDVNRISKYPLLMRDIEGNSMYMFTNTTCLYRRDGRMLPYGSGDISGVIVHEKYDAFEYSGEPNDGTIGRYQIRHLTREDINFKANVEDGFSDFITEYQYCKMENGVFQPTRGNNGFLTHSAPEEETGSIGYPTLDYSYLGPIGSENRGNKNGNGVILPDGSQLSTSPKTNYPNYPENMNNSGKGDVSSDDRSAMLQSCAWWNTRTNHGESWMVKVSTEGYTTTQLSMQLAIINFGVGRPRYYTIDWSTQGDNNSTDWNKVTEITVPDIVQWGSTRWWQLPGYKYLNVPLPLEMLGKKEVWVRICAARDVAGSNTEGTGYNDAVSSPGQVGLSYLAIRYNK